MKKTVIVFLSLLLAFSLTSCGSDRLVIKTSDSATMRLKPGTLTKEDQIAWTQNAIDDKYFVVEITNDELSLTALSAQQYIEYKQSTLKRFNYGFFMGVNMHLCGWVCYYDSECYTPGSDKSPELITNSSCVDIIGVDKEHGYILTSQPLFEDAIGGSYDNGLIWEISYDSDLKEWKWDEPRILDGNPCGGYYCEETNEVYIVTSTSLISVAGDGSLKTLITSDTINNMAATSIVAKDGCIYCGSPMGVYRYNIASGNETWYPIAPSSAK